MKVKKLITQPIALGLLSLFLQNCKEPIASKNEHLEFDKKLLQVTMNTQSIPKGSFTYEFWYNSDFEHEIDSENAHKGDGGSSGQNYAIFPEHTRSDNIRGTGVSVGANGISVYEHKNAYINARIVYKAKTEGWTHVAIVYTENSPRLYVNGKNVGKRKRTQDEIIPLFSLGAQYDTSGRFDGKIDEFRIWSRALSEEEVNSNLRFQLTGLENGLNRYYNFDTYAEDQLVYDNSGNSNHGKLIQLFSSNETSDYLVNCSVFNSTISFSPLTEQPVPDTTNNLTFNIENYEDESEQIKLSGWCFNKNRSSEDLEVYLAFLSNDTSFLFETISIQRPDVTVAQELNNYDNSGFLAAIDKNQMVAGAYTLSLVLSNGAAIDFMHITEQITTVK